MSQTKAELLTDLEKRVKHCTKCPLYQGTTNPVPGAGDPEAEIMFIGEAPGYHEDQQGLPFVGRAGQLLNKALAQIGLQRDEVYIANVIKHRPPENRDPTTEELNACRPYLLEQIQIIQPKIIVALGRFSMNLFLPEAKISRDHGQPRWVDWQAEKVLVVPLFHPAAALRNPAVMRQFIDDVKRLPDIIASLKLNLLPTDESATPSGPASPPVADDPQLSLL